MRHALTIALISLAFPVQALDLSPPGATLTAQVASQADSVRLPRSSWQPGVVFSETEGAIRRSAYLVPNSSLTTLQLLQPLRAALLDAGYEEVFTCADTACGGFDFRFQLDLLPAPDMFVDLGNYRYLLMEKPGARPTTVSVLASTSARQGHLHVTEVSDAEFSELPLPDTTVSDQPDDAEGLIDNLLQAGHTVLSDLEFTTGSSELGPGPYASLETLASWLRDTPGARIVLVGHTDSVGSLEANTTLSRRRALSVLNRLVETLGANVNQIAADGAGALSPIASNLDPDGRAANRRVEVVLLSIE